MNRFEVQLTYSEAEYRVDTNAHNRLEYIADVLFDFTTYDGGLSQKMATNMLAVLECIFKKETFAYIEASNENYVNYITNINMPFLQGKLEWGTSIRGAWLDTYGKNKDEVLKIGISGIEIKRFELEEFIGVLIDWGRK